MVSVVIPAFNSAPYISATLDSVLCQTFKDFEIVVVDDGSTDETQKVIKHYADRYPESIRCFYKENGGASAARNYGVKNAAGEYIAFLDSDDLWYPEKLEKSMASIQEHPGYGLLCHSYRVRENGSPKGEARVNDAYNALTPEMVFRQFYFENKIGTSTVVMEKDLFYKAGGFDETLWAAQDYDLWIRCARVTRIFFLDEILSEYRRREGSITSVVEKKLPCEIMIMEKYIDLFPEEERKRIKRQKLRNIYVNVAMRALEGKNRALARSYLLNGLKQNFFNLKTAILLLCVLILKEPLPVILRLDKLQRSI